MTALLESINGQFLNLHYHMYACTFTRTYLCSLSFYNTVNCFIYKDKEWGWEDEMDGYFSQSDWNWPLHDFKWHFGEHKVL